MALSLTTTRNNPLWIMDLPLELHLRIRSLLLADPDTTLNQLRTIRLVCKSFDSIYAPVVFSHMVLFPSKLPYPARVTYLRSLVHGLQSATSPQLLCPFSSYCTTLTIKDWRFAATPIDRRSSLIPPYRDRRTILLGMRRRFWNRGLTTTSFFALIILGAIIFLVISVVHSTTGAAIYFSIIIAIFLILWAISYRKSFNMERIRWRIKSVVYVPQARHYITLLPKRLELPNVRCVRLFIHSRESDWSIYRSTRLLLSLPQLTELELTFSSDTDLTYLTKCLAHLNQLHKLSLPRARGRISLPHTASLVTALIAQNEHLTHFEYDWRIDVPFDLSLLFRNVPNFKPLRLLHMALNSTCTNFKALVPHIQSLTSFQFHYGKNTWCNAFLRANVFPTTIKVERVDAELILFIREHPGIVNLSISNDTSLRLEEIPLFNVLCRHVQSLHHLCLNTTLLARMVSNVEFEMDFLRCTANLRELILLNGETMSYHTRIPRATYGNNEQRIFAVIAGLNRFMTVVLASEYKEILSWSLAFCRTSTNSLVRDLERRLVYEKWSSWFHAYVLRWNLTINLTRLNMLLLPPFDALPPFDTIVTLNTHALICSHFLATVVPSSLSLYKYKSTLLSLLTFWNCHFWGLGSDDVNRRISVRSSHRSSRWYMERLVTSH